MPSGDDDILSQVLGKRRDPRLRGYFSRLGPSRATSPQQNEAEFERIMGRDARSFANRTAPVPALDPSLRQFAGSELAPPGPGTYFNPRRYAEQGFSPRNTEVARNNLTRAWQQNLALNVLANPQAARQIESDRILSQYGGGGGITGRPVGSGFATPETTTAFISEHGVVNPDGTRTVRLPSGGTATVMDSPIYGQNKRTEPRRYFD